MRTLADLKAEEARRKEAFEALRAKETERWHSSRPVLYRRDPTDRHYEEDMAVRSTPEELVQKLKEGEDLEKVSYFARAHHASPHARANLSWVSIIAASSTTKCVCPCSLFFFLPPSHPPPQGVMRDMPLEDLTPQMEARLLEGISLCYRRMADAPAALPPSQRASELARQLHGEESLEAARCMRALAESHRLAKKFDKGRRTADGALVLLETLGLRKHPEYAATLGEVGRIELGRGSATEALLFFQRAMGTAEPTVVPGLLQGAALCYESMGDTARALKQAAEATEAARKVFSASHADLGRQLEEQGALCFRLQKLPESAACFEEALTVYRASLGPSHITTTRVERLLGRTGESEESSLSWDMRMPMRRPPGEILRMCGYCELKQPAGMMLCTRCRTTYYCDVKCQHAHWPRHKNVCKKPEEKK